MKPFLAILLFAIISQGQEPTPPPIDFSQKIPTIKKAVQKLKDYADTANASAVKATADLATTQAQLVAETKAHADALVESDTLQVQIDALKKDDDQKTAEVAKQAKELEKYHREKWYLSMAIAALCFIIIIRDIGKIPFLKTLTGGWSYVVAGGASIAVGVMVYNIL